MLFALHVEPFYNKKSDTPNTKLERNLNDIIMKNLSGKDYLVSKSVIIKVMLIAINP